MPAETKWHMVMGPDRTMDGVEIYPDRDAGIAVTFQHQDHNRDTGDWPWRSGKPCLDRPIGAFGRETWGAEPQALGPRLQWNVERLLSWINAAASGTLSSPGDPLELPARPNGLAFPLIGFSESAADMILWDKQPETWGLLEFAVVPGAKDTVAVSQFLGPDANLIRSVAWGSWVASAPKSISPGLWIRIPDLPIVAPWQIPTTWRELSEFLDGHGIELSSKFALAGRHFRKHSDDRVAHRLLLGFPLAERVGEPPTRLHWLGIGSIGLAHRKQNRNGFRPTEQNREVWDANLARSVTPIAWLRTGNWASDQLRKRGAAEDIVRGKRILVLGAGTLGSAVAENLLRMGVTELGVLDRDLADVGNLSRHVLGMESVGRGKAMSLAQRLNAALPDAHVEPYVHAFPPTDQAIGDALRGYDVIVDCTASDEVLTALANFDWQGEKLFISLAMSWRAEGLLAYCASEASFPAVDAQQRFGAIPAPEIDLADAQIEGIGCWHPVFPATADDVQLWAAIGTKFVRRSILSPARRCDYFRQLDDGTVERVDA